MKKGTGSELMAEHATEKRPRRGACTLFQHVASTPALHPGAPGPDFVRSPRHPRCTSGGGTPGLQRPPLHVMLPIRCLTAPDQALLLARV